MLGRLDYGYSSLSKSNLNFITDSLSYDEFLTAISGTLAQTL